MLLAYVFFFFFQAEDGIRDYKVTGVQTCALPISAFPNSRSRTPPLSATGIRADARAYTPTRDGGLREKACSTAFAGQPAKAEPTRLCETSRRGPHNRRALQRASPRSGRRSRPIPHVPAAACSARG